MSTTYQQLGLIPTGSSTPILATTRRSPTRPSPNAEWTRRYVIPAPGGLGYIMVDADRSNRVLAGVTDVFRAGGWIFENRTPIAIGGAALLALGVLGWLRG